ncbi:hypothetical protein [Streptomyces sp. 7N604]|uniref:hypothetical protein n=1 Tax=Streptomyces sp. 7N604 TaxID=3457415 RepID=UPI003FCF9740
MTAPGARPRGQGGAEGPGGSERGIPDGLLVGVLAFLLGLTLLVWTATGLAGLLAHGAWPKGVHFTHTPVAMRHLAAQPHDLASAWPGTPASQLSGYGLFWGIFIGELMVLFVLAVFAIGAVTRWRAAGLRGAGERGAARHEDAKGAGTAVHDGAPEAEAARHDGASEAGTARPEGSTEAAPAPSRPSGALEAAQGPVEASPAPFPAHSTPSALAAHGAPSEASPPRNGQRNAHPHPGADPAHVDGPAPSADQHPGFTAHGESPDAATGYPSAGTAFPTAGIASGGPAPTDGGATRHPHAYASVGEADAAPVAVGRPAGPGQQPPARVHFTGTGSAPRRELALQAIRSAEGPVLVTTSDPALWAETKDARAKLGPVHVYDPSHLIDTPARLRWSPSAGCESRDAAAARAAALLAPVRPAHALDSAMADAAETLLRCWLHAAAVGGQPFRQVHRWASGSAAHDAVRILRTHPKAAHGSAGELESTLTAHPERREVAQQLTARALSALSSIHIRNACNPARADALALESFVAEGGTLYVVGEAIEDPRTHPGAMPLLTALVSSVVEHGRRMAARSSAGRLDPPLTLVLDDVAAVAPLPQLPELLAGGAAQGLLTLAILRSEEQARARWPHRSLAGDAWS